MKGFKGTISVLALFVLSLACGPAARADEAESISRAHVL